MLLSPISQTQDEEFNEGRLQQQLLVLGAELGETRDALRPLPDHLHGGCEQVVKLLDVARILLLVGADFRLVVLKSENSREVQTDLKKEGMTFPCLIFSFPTLE